MGQITTQWTRDGYLNTDYNLRSQVDASGVLTANAPNYEQVAGLIADLMATGSASNFPKDMEDFSDIIEMLDTTEHNFYDMIPTGPRPKDVEFYWNVEELDSMEVPIRSGGALSQVSSDPFTLGDNGSPGPAAPVVPLDDVIDTTSKIGSRLRSGHVLQNSTNGSHEQMLVFSFTDPTGGTGELFLIRGYNAGGRVQIGSAKIPAAQTTAHSEGDTLQVVNLVTSENNIAPPSFRTGYERRMNLIQIVDFSINKGFLESLFQRINAPGYFKDPVQHSRDIHELQFFEIWDRNALFGVPQRLGKQAYKFYQTGGIIHEIKKYCTLKWSDTGDDTGVGGWYDIDTDTTNVSNFKEYHCNGDSNYRKGQPGDPSTPVAFGEDMLNELNDYVIDKLGNNGKNERFIPSTIIGPRKFRRIFGQFTEDRLRVSKQLNATGGYYADSYITDNGNILKYVVDDHIGDRILIGNPAHGKRRPLLTLAMYKPPVQTRSETLWFTSIQGFQWDYPEYAWGLWENVTTA